MRRPVSLVLALIMAVSAAVMSSPHVHASSGHDHPEHRHGPASHGDDQHHASRPAATHEHHDARDEHDEHDAQGQPGARDRRDAQSRHDPRVRHDSRARHGAEDRHDGGVDGDAGFYAEACDAGDHVLRVPATAGPLPQAYAQLAVLTMTIEVVPVSSGRLAAAPIDVRVHGPPPDTRLPARAPPLTSLA